MTNERLIAELLQKTSVDETLLGNVLVALAEQKMHQHIRAEVLKTASFNDLANFRHESLGCLLLWVYAKGDANVLLTIAGAGLEDANYHQEAAAVRALA